MNPNTKLILDELKSVQSNLTNRIDVVEHSIGSRVGVLEDAAKVFDDWKPKMDASVAELCTEIGTLWKTEEKVEMLREEMTALRKSVSRSALDATQIAPSGVLPPPKVSAASIPAGWTQFRPLGHHEESSHRGFESSTQSPVKGTFIPPDPNSQPKLHRSYSSTALDAGNPGGSGGVNGAHDHRCYEDGNGGNHHLPKINFPHSMCKSQAMAGAMLRLFRDVFCATSPLGQGIYHALVWGRSMLVAGHGGTGSL